MNVSEQKYCPRLMSVAIKNQSSSNVQVYVMCTNSTSGSDLPSLQNLASSALSYVGETETADSLTVCALDNPKYILAGVWSGTASSGSASSWIVIEPITGITVGTGGSKYKLAVTGTQTNGFVLTISNGTGVSLTVLWIILVVIVGLLVLIGLGYGLFHLISSRPSATSSTIVAGVPYYMQQ
jgi:hypothetical protein